MSTPWTLWGWYRSLRPERCAGLLPVPPADAWCARSPAGLGSGLAIPVLPSCWEQRCPVVLHQPAAASPSAFANGQPRSRARHPAVARPPAVGLGWESAAGAEAPAPGVSGRDPGSQESDGPGSSPGCRQVEVRASAACGRCASPSNMSRRHLKSGQHERRRFHPIPGPDRRVR